VPRRRTCLTGLAAFASLVLLAAWLIPQWLDWTRYRATIEVLASATLGQPVTIQGPITLALLPQPVLTAAQVNVGGREPTNLSIHVDALRLRVALWPLIGGRVDARELVLRGPDLRIPWPTEPGMLQARPPAWLAAFAVRIENGRLTVGRLAFTAIDATLATLETGALSAAGTAQFGDLGWNFTARLTAAGADGAAGLNVTLDGQGKANGLGASVTGQLAADGTLAGTIASRGPNLAVLLPAPPVPFRADSRLTVGSGLAAIDGLAIEIGGSPASGSLALRVAPQQRLDVALSASRLDLDAWLPVLLRAGTTIAGIDVPIGFAFSTEAAPLGGGTLEHVRAAFDLVGNDLVVRDASASLPGNGMLHLSGRIARDDPAHPRFEGDARLDAPVLRTTLRWLDDTMPGTLPAGMLSGAPNGVLQRAELSAHVVTGGGEISLSQLAGSVDDAPIVGRISFKRGEPPSLKADLTLDRLALDPWLPVRLPDLADLSHLASGVDAELRFDVRQATWAGSTINGLAVDAAIEAGSVLVRRIEGVARGAHIVASGMLGEGGRLSDGVLTLVTSDASPLADLLPNAWRATPAFWHGPADLEVQAAGPQEAFATSARLTLADAQLEARPTFDLGSGAWTGTLTLHHPGARRLIATLGLSERLGVPGLPAWLGDGSLSLVAHLAGTPSRLAADTFDLNAATLHAGGDVALDRGGAEPQLSGHIHADSLALPVPDVDSGVPLPLGILRGWRGDLRVEVRSLLAGSRPVLRDASVDLAVADERLRFERFSAKLGSGAVSGEFAFDAAAGPPSLSLQVRLSDATIDGPLADAPIDLLSGRADGSLRLTATGYSPSTILATLDGQARLTVADGALSGFDLFRMKLAVEKPNAKDAEAAASDALASGATGFDRLDLRASLSRGDLSLDEGLLTGIAGEARFAGGINLATQAVDVRIALQPALPNPPEIAIRVTGPIDRPNRTPQLANLARWMAELAR
jgi:AsmA-like C-terminal region/AsmA family